MRHRTTRTLTASAALLSIAVATGCAQDGPDPAEETVDAMATSSSSQVPPPATPTSPPPATPPATPSAPSPTALPNAAPAAPLIAAATWADSDFGVTLKVAPTPAGREAWDSLAAAEAWQQVLRLAPEAGSPGMREQFDCHWTWARILEPDKPTWNIEPWRPVVGADRMLAEGCNPGGPEV
ncbi:DUF2599 domain-containing protein [Rhodococcus sp. IEGM 1408]|uniref:DUF2599 domain-containing protein n=1 Tax=Rhodococcus sp. IEGM 1408 TaxID=3082220 RepID=UPI0029553833|nr:DUF2599 domain-containing protein [Rhodococcus sp. IEGM 1408]MDV7999800.1 DUF2599 domain-containing protein [Rhodococcus sp. IEGM 1408]